MPIKSPQSYLGVRAPVPPNVITAERNPVATDVDFVIGDLWVNTSTGTTFQLSQIVAGAATWTANGSGAAGGVVTLTGSSGGARSPTAGNINLVGTANQITTSGAASTITWSLPAAITAPGSLTTTTTLAAGTSASAGTTITAGTGITSTTGNIVATAGAVNAGTSMTATAGNITATLGNVVINGAAKQLQVHGGAATDFVGTTTLNMGVSPDIANTNISANDVVLVTRFDQNGSTALGVFTVTITPTTKFVITANKPADGTTETGDTSKVAYFIVRRV